MAYQRRDTPRRRDAVDGPPPPARRREGSWDRLLVRLAALLLGAALGCGSEPAPTPAATRGFVTELDGATVSEIPICADQALSEPAFTLAPTERVRVLEVKSGAPSDGGAVYRIAHGDRAGWVAAYWLER